MVKDTKPFWFITGLVAILLLGWVDHLTGPFISVKLFFLIPVSLVAWHVGRGPAFFLAFISAAEWLAADAFDYLPGLLTTAPYWNALSELVLFGLVTYILPTLKNQLDLEKAQARTDYLTGAANKRYFLELAEGELQRFRRYHHPFTLAYIDIDNFKLINDRFGHNTGDVLLQAVAKTIRQKVRTLDLLTRLGGDEFAILFPETQPEPAQIVVRRIQQALSDLVHRNEWPVTFSMGVVTFLSSPSSTDEMLKKADVMLYAAKHSGKNVIRHEVVTPSAAAPPPHPAPKPGHSPGSSGSGPSDPGLPA